jgi:hypothetical protein
VVPHERSESRSEVNDAIQRIPITMSGQAHGASISVTNFQIWLLTSTSRLGIFRPSSNENAPFFEEYLQASCIRYTGLYDTETWVRHTRLSCLGGGLTRLLSDLTKVAEQGVLWLNTCLTVRAHKAHSHSKQGWETFTTAVLKAVTTRSITTEEGETRKGVVFLSWGAPALKICQSIGVSNVSTYSVLFRNHFVNSKLSTLVKEEPFVEVEHCLVKYQRWLTLFVQVRSSVSSVGQQRVPGERSFQSCQRMAQERIRRRWTDRLDGSQLVISIRYVSTLRDFLGVGSVPVDNMFALR